MNPHLRSRLPRYRQISTSVRIVLAFIVTVLHCTYKGRRWPFVHQKINNVSNEHRQPIILNNICAPVKHELKIDTLLAHFNFIPLWKGNHTWIGKAPHSVVYGGLRIANGWMGMVYEGIWIVNGEVEEISS